MTPEQRTERLLRDSAMLVEGSNALRADVESSRGDRVALRERAGRLRTHSSATDRSESDV